jgi:hypothetical protein
VYILAFLVILAISLLFLWSPIAAVVIALPLFLLFLLWRGWKRPKPGEEPGAGAAATPAGEKQGPRFTHGEPRSGEGA